MWVEESEQGRVKEAEKRGDTWRGVGYGVKDSWSNGCKAVNSAKNSLLRSGSMNADA